MSKREARRDPPRREWPKCAECGKVEHPDRVRRLNGLPHCPDCAADPPSERRYRESAGF